MNASGSDSQWKMMTLNSNDAISPVRLDHFSDRYEQVSQSS